MIALLLLVSMASADRPSRELTPGVTRPISRTTVCATRWGLDRRHVTEAMRKQVFTNYGIPYSQHRSYELDHLTCLVNLEEPMMSRISGRKNGPARTTRGKRTGSKTRCIAQCAPESCRSTMRKRASERLALLVPSLGSALMRI
jgi:hypothetical protein